MLVIFVLKVLIQLPLQILQRQAIFALPATYAYQVLMIKYPALPEPLMIYWAEQFVKSAQ